MTSPAIAAPLARLGDAMRRHSRLIITIQWLVVLFYFSLLIIPAFLPLPDRHGRILTNLTLLAQFVFWGIWWPFVLLSMLLFGRIWCGVFCPEGAISEWASKHGLGLGIPRWMRWGGWPAVGFTLTTIYGQLISVYDYAQAAMLVLGGSTVAAVIIGLLYGRGKRVWCRYLCPVSGVFNLLARLSPIHFRVAEERWKENAQPRLPLPNCAPLVDIFHMKGASACHACGRCSGQRHAVKLSLRSPSEEVVVFGDMVSDRWSSILLLYGVIGLAMGAFHWTVSPWFIDIKQYLAGWLVEHGQLWVLNTNAPWWLLTHYPQVNDAFNWLDGFMVLSYILGTSLIVGSALALLYWLASRISRIAFHHLVQSLIPLGGAGVFLGLSATTVKLLRFDGFALDWVQNTRILILAGTACWSLYLAWRIMSYKKVNAIRCLEGMLAILPAVALIVGGWWLQFWGFNLM